jgi:hypothetical protein
MGELFCVDRSVITKNLKNIFVDNRLDANSICVKFAPTYADGKNYQTKYNNFDTIIAVVYQGSSKQVSLLKRKTPGSY